MLSGKSKGGKGKESILAKTLHSLDFQKPS